MITEDYVSFETAKLLKEKGFDWGLLSNAYLFKGNTYELAGKVIEADADVIIPTQATAMKWLREKEWVICVIPLTFYCGEKVSSWGYNIWAGDNIEIGETGNLDTPEFNTYEEACENAIRYCLKNI